MRTFGEALRIAVQGTIDPAGGALRDQASSVPASPSLPRAPTIRSSSCPIPRACSCRWSTRPSRAS
jgi:hypothetical protein